MTLRHTIAASALFFSISLGVAANTVGQNYVLNTELAESIAKEAVAECRKSDAHISVSVVDDQGRLVYFFRGNGSGPHTIRTSFKKAYTAATLKAPTSAVVAFLDMPGLSQLGDMDEDILLLPAGLPIPYKQSVIGAIGLSGSPNPSLEEECGKKAIEKIMSSLSN